MDAQDINPIKHPFLEAVFEPSKGDCRSGGGDDEASLVGFFDSRRSSFDELTVIINVWLGLPEYFYIRLVPYFPQYRFPGVSLPSP